MTRPARKTNGRPISHDPAPSRTRRGFFRTIAQRMLGSALGVGLFAMSATFVLWLLGIARFFFPNIRVEPPMKFKVGFPTDYEPGQVETRLKSEFGVWIVRTHGGGQSRIYAVKAVCTHLGCTPIWQAGEQKFKCPCHGSGFDKEGVNFEGPAPRPLERYAIRVAEDGQIEVDKSREFRRELGQWDNPGSYVIV